VERAKQIEPLGQVIITHQAERDSLLLENGDEIRVPTRDGLVVVSGEVLFPTAIAFSPEFSLSDYIQSAGGYSQSADSSRIILAHRDGTFETIEPDRTLFLVSSRGDVRDGDEILVLPKIDVKSRQIFKDLTQILYQVAISAKVVLGL
jgi:protein involved in polysaccharide export with SLBB domain